MFRPRCWIRSTIVLLLAFFILTTCAHSQGDRSARGKAVLIKAGRILDVRLGTYQADQCVLVEGGRIKEVGGRTVCARASKRATVIDLSRATVLPGLIDSHSHLLSANEGRSDPTARMTEAQRQEIGATNAREYLEAGVTTVRNLGYGINGDVALRDQIKAGHIPGPRIFASTRKLTPPGGQGVTSSSAPDFIRNFAEVSGVESARRAVRENIAAGADVIKVVVDVGLRLLSLEEVKTIVEEAHRAKRKVAAHATSAAAIRVAVEAGVDAVEHGTEASEEVLRQMRERGIFLVPTSFTEGALRDIFAAELRRSKPAEQADFEAFVRGYKEMAPRRIERALRAGVRIAAGSDIIWRYPGKTRGQASLINLEALRREGMAGAEVVRAATLNAAELLGMSDQVGSVEPGKLADIIAVEGDPLTDTNVLQRVKFVMKGGAVVKHGSLKAD